MEELLSTNASCLCRLCNKRTSKYTCPKCGIDYCSLSCYKSENHLECSELFYRNWVEMEMQLKNYDPENKKKMLEILERFNEESKELNVIEDILEDIDGDTDELDSDDENDVPSLEERVAKINLDDADEIWSVLTESERQEFETILMSADVEKVLPKWKPWWEQEVERKLVRELDEIPSYVKFCPPLITIPEIKGELKVSPYVKNNLVNVILSYAYTALHFFGDHASSPKLATRVFLHVCDNMNHKKVFNDVDSAIEAVHSRIFEESDITEDERQGIMLSIKEAADKILSGPDEMNCSFYLNAALSDLYTLLLKARAEQSVKSQSDARFPNKFREHDIDKIDISRKSLQLHLKKLEFYIMWTNLYGKSLCGSRVNS